MMTCKCNTFILDLVTLSHTETQHFKTQFCEKKFYVRLPNIWRHCSFIIDVYWRASVAKYADAVVKYMVNPTSAT